MKDFSAGQFFDLENIERASVCVCVWLDNVHIATEQQMRGEREGKEEEIEREREGSK